MDLDLKHLLQYARRWWWLALALPLLAGLTAYFVADRQAPVYSATTTLRINPAGLTGSVYSDIWAAQNLASTYQSLAATQPVLARAADRLGEPYTAGVLGGMVSSSIIRDTLLMTVSAQDNDPVRAALIANVVAEEFATLMADQEASTSTEAQARTQELIDDTEATLAATKSKIAELEASGATTDLAQQRLDALRLQLGQQEESLANLLTKQNEMQLQSALAQNTIAIAEEATPSYAPVAPRKMFYTFLGLFFGALIAAGTILLLEYFDNTVKPGQVFEEQIGVPVLSIIPFAQKMKKDESSLFLLTRPRTNLAEAMRLMRTNVEFAAANQEIASLAVTSAGPSEGKSTVTANLAVALAQAGFSVILVDADLRKPAQHRMFGLDNGRGFSTLLARPGTAWQSAAQDVMPNLKVIASGPIPPSPADLLSSERLQGRLKELTAAADVVLIDTPPALAVADPLVIASTVDAVVLVAWSGKTRIEALRRSIDLLQAGSVRLIGVVLNRQKGGAGSGYYYYDSEYYTHDPGGSGDASSSSGASRSAGALGRESPQAPAAS